MENVIKEIEKECRDIFEKHDKEINEAHRWDHVERVRKTALEITKLYNKNKEKVNKHEIEIAVLLHDIGKYKEKDGNHNEWSYKLAKPILKKYIVDKEVSGIDVEKILKVIRNHSYHREEDCDDKDIFNNIEFKIVTDADRIDGSGSIGILRASLDKRFNSIEKQIKHIEDKVKGYPLRTDEGKEIGEKHRKHLKSFLRELENGAKFKVRVRGVIEKDGKILFCRHVDKSRDYYFFPGGHVDPGEIAKDALSRELKEELKIIVKDISFIGAMEDVFTKENGEKHYDINLFFSVFFESVEDKSKEDDIDFFFLDKKQLLKEKIYPTVLPQTIIKWQKDKKIFWLSH